MTDEEVETIGQMLYELDRQKGLCSHRWHTDAETKRNRYRLRAHRLLALEDFARLVARLDRQYRRAGQLTCKTDGGFRPIPASSVRY